MSWRIALIKFLSGKDATRQYVLREVVKSLYNTIGSEDILQEVKGTIVYRGRTLTNQEVKQLKDEADILSRLKLWEILKSDVKYQANKKIFKEAATLEQLESGRMLSYVFDIIDTRIKRLQGIPTSRDESQTL